MSYKTIFSDVDYKVEFKLNAQYILNEEHYLKVVECPIKNSEYMLINMEDGKVEGFLNNLIMSSYELRQRNIFSIAMVQ